MLKQDEKNSKINTRWWTTVIGRRERRVGMGIYFNPGNGSFRQAVRSEIYVDKTGLLEVLNKRIFSESKCVALSHARRFGKSQAAGMIDAYYSKGSDSKELFSGFEIAGKPDFEEHLNKYNVIHLDISSFTDSYRNDLVEKITETLYEEFAEECPEVDYSKPIQTVLSHIYKNTKAAFIIIIDEWDCVVRNFADDQELVHRYLQFLHSLFKSEESKTFIALGYITGILPIKKIKNESALNNFSEYTMLQSDEFTPYFGFTKNEVVDICKRFDMNFESVEKWYDGYVISGRHMYNPNSVCEAMSRHRLDSFWKNTSSFTTINDLITLNFDGLKEDILTMLSGGYVPVKVNKFQNDLTIINSKDDALTALIHLGYLGYDCEEGEAFMPNYEVSTAFEAALETGNWKEVADTISKCDELLWATIDGEAEKVAEYIELAHDTYTSILKYNDENSLSCAITMAYFTAPAYYNVIRELPSGKGFADIAFIPRKDSGNKPAMIIELKWDKDADTAIRQIKEKRYTGALSGYEKEIRLVGISYNKDSSDKKHECVIE